MLETLYDPADPHERCGLILKDGSIVEIENIAEDKTNSYEMAPDAVLPFLDAETIAATWHTHTAPNPDPNLSGADHEGFCAYPDLEHHIVGVRDGAVTVERYRVDKGVVIVCD